MSTATRSAHSELQDYAHTPSDVAAKSHSILAAAREAGQKSGLRYAGNVSPQDAWHLFSRQIALLIDVRTAEELRFVGHVPHSLHVAWATGMDMQKNPRFLRELETVAGKNDVILFLCRSGKRSIAAAETATAAGFQNAFNVDEGFEGEIIGDKRGLSGGWRSYDLPWVQE